MEITKVIEKGVALGVNFKNSKEDNEVGWSVPVQEEEIERLNPTMKATSSYASSLEEQIKSERINFINNEEQRQ